MVCQGFLEGNWLVCYGCPDDVERGRGWASVFLFSLRPMSLDDESVPPPPPGATKSSFLCPETKSISAGQTPAPMVLCPLIQLQLLELLEVNQANGRLSSCQHTEFQENTRTGRGSEEKSRKTRTGTNCLRRTPASRNTAAVSPSML